MKYMFKPAFIACLCKDTNNGVISYGQIICVNIGADKVYDLANKKVYDYRANLQKHYHFIDESDDNQIYAMHFSNLNNHYILSYNMLTKTINDFNNRGLFILTPNSNSELSNHEKEDNNLSKVKK